MRCVPSGAILCYGPPMTVAMKTSVGLTALAVLAGGAVLWTKFGSLVYFDVIAGALVGCFL